MPGTDIQIHTNQAPRPASLNGLRVREDVAFTNAGGDDDKSARKRVGKVLEGLSDVLQRMMAQDEVVLYAARAQAPIGALEQWGMGWYVYRVTIAALVFTNQRLLHFALLPDGKWKGSVKTLAYGDIQAAKPSGLLSGVLWLTYKSGKKEKYWGMKRADVAKLKALFAALLPASAGASTPAAGMVSLCPDCWAPLTVYYCGRCGLVFKDENTLKKRSLLIPGGGYFYCGQTFLGVMDVIAEAWLILILIGSLLGAAQTWGKPPAKPDDPDAVAFLVVAAFMVVILVLKKLMTIHHCRRFIREFISTGQKDPMRAQMAAAGTLK